MHVTLTVVVVASGRPTLAARLEPLVEACAQHGVELLVADARSHGERDEPLEHGGADVVRIDPEVAGDGTARDAALRAASGDWVVLLDDDVVVTARWLQELLRDVGSAAPGVGAVTGRAVVTESASVPVQDRAVASSLLPADVAYRRLPLLCAGGFEQRYPRPGSRHVEVLEQLRRRGWRVVPGTRAPVQTLLRPQVWGRGAPDVPGWRRRLSGLATRRDVRAVLFDGFATLVDLTGIEGEPRPVQGAREVVAGLRRRGLLLGIVSDERVDDVRAIGLVDAMLGPFDVWAVCSHAPEEACRCRTADSGLVLESTARLGVAPSDVLVVGERARHVEAARAVGALGAVVTGGPSSLRDTLGGLAGTRPVAG